MTENKRTLDLKEIQHATTFEGNECVTLGCELKVEIAKEKDKIRLIEYSTNETLTNWVKLNAPEELRSSKKAKSLRDRMKERIQNSQEVIDRTVTVIEENVQWKEQKPISRKVATLLTEDFIAEEVYNPSEQPQPEFAVYYFATEEFKIESTFDLGEVDQKTGRKIIYEPVFNDHVKKGMVILPRKPEPCNIPEVVKESMQFVFTGYDPCGKDNALKLEVLIAITSWILDKEKPRVPIAGIGVFAVILPIRGPSGSGKNRLANLLRFLTYHPFFDVSTHRIPSLYRPLDIWKGTLVLDEADLRSTGETSELIHFLNSRATGTPIGRQNPEKGSQCDCFESFGITIVTQRRHFDDNATEGRAIPFYSDVSEKQLPTLETEEMIQKGLELQDKLLYIRMKHWNDINIEKTRWVESVSDHRLNSALLPLMALSSFDASIGRLVKDIVQSVEKERRKLKAQSDDGVIVNILWEKVSEGLWNMHNGLCYVGGDKELEGSEDDPVEVVKPLTVSHIAESLKRTSKDVRKILTSLNIAPESVPDRIRVSKHVYRPIFFDLHKLEKRLKEFVVDYEKDELKAVTGVTNVTDKKGNPEKTLIDFDGQQNTAGSGKAEKSVTTDTCVTESTMKDVKDWCRAEQGKNETSEISLNDLTSFIANELHQQPNSVIDRAFKEEILMPSPNSGKAVVV